jgi:hypothetical protein
MFHARLFTLNPATAVAVVARVRATTTKTTTVKG